MSASTTEPTELELLRKVANAAQACFEFEGAVRHDAQTILEEALRSAREDFNNLMDANTGSATRLDGSAFMRAASRCELALALAEYRRSFGETRAAQGDEGTSS